MEESVFWTHLTTLNALRNFMAMTTDPSPRRHHGNPMITNEVIDIEGAGDTIVIGVIWRVLIASNLESKGMKEATLTEVPIGNMEMME